MQARISWSALILGTIVMGALFVGMDFFIRAVKTTGMSENGLFRPPVGPAGFSLATFFLTLLAVLAAAAAGGFLAARISGAATRWQGFLHAAGAFALAVVAIHLTGHEHVFVGGPINLGTHLGEMTGERGFLGGQRSPGFFTAGLLWIAFASLCAGVLGSSLGGIAAAGRKAPRRIEIERGLMEEGRPAGVA